MHQHFDWFVNWTTNTLQGSIILDIMVLNGTQQYIQLDAWDILLERVEMVPPGAALNATMNAGNVIVYDGQPLGFLKFFTLSDDWCIIIDLGTTFTVGTEFSIQVFYETQPTAEGLQWLTPT